MTIYQWTEENETQIARAVLYLKEDVENGDTFDWALSHIAELCDIRRDLLSQEYELRNQD